VTLGRSGSGGVCNAHQFGVASNPAAGRICGVRTKKITWIGTDAARTSAMIVARVPIVWGPDVACPVVQDVYAKVLVCGTSSCLSRTDVYVLRRPLATPRPTGMGGGHQGVTWIGKVVGRGST
jgi:hypothetical protein